MIYTKELLTEYRKKNTNKKAAVLNFLGVGGRDVYNITAPFDLNGQEVIAGRVESRDDEHSHINLFKEVNDSVWEKLDVGIDLALQDPFYTRIDGKIILGGVEAVFFDNGKAKWRTVFYQLDSISEAYKVFEGPWGMKDLRLKQQADGRILVLTRSQGEKGGRGKIGFCIIDQFSNLTIQMIEDAPLLSNQFCDEEWGGGNEIHQINEDIWILGHIANFDVDGNRHYYAMSFKVDIENKAMCEAKIIAERRDFIDGPAKRPDLVDVVFSGGIQLHGERAVLYVGISDAGAQKIEIENPFK
ncbi:DUF1861 family protein [Enterococcus sp. BWT-B8]|uniref:DUF1861 family protein n=1 Tax=Enterococcus sp. BWT-B8 TaxID=2885157 RepID=UPI001E51CB05|nr:DUF1861 family protein [Enterococcus sp. BWT-B8]MCB5952666.1 DUF1861 family protein [Enterococcus sp. BWT-B8]